MSNPANELARWSQHRATWGVLTAAYRDCELCHAIASVVHDTLGYSYNRFPQESTRAALWLKNWRKELLDDGLFARQPSALRLRFAIDMGFEPGLYAPWDVEESTPDDRSFGGQLKNLGFTKAASTYR